MPSGILTELKMGAAGSWPLRNSRTSEIARISGLPAVVTTAEGSSRPLSLMEPQLIDALAREETFYWWRRIRLYNTICDRY